LLRDAQLFESKLGQIDGAGDTAAYLIRLVNEKSPESPPTTSIGEDRRSTETSTAPNGDAVAS